MAEIKIEQGQGFSTSEDTIEKAISASITIITKEDQAIIAKLIAESDELFAHQPNINDEEAFSEWSKNVGPLLIRFVNLERSRK